MTPAQMAYKVEHPHSDTFPDTLVAKDCKIHIEIEFPVEASLAQPMVRAVMTSLRTPTDPSYFHPLTIAVLSSSPYEFSNSVQDEAQSLGASAVPDISSRVRTDLKVWSQHLPFCPTVPKFYMNPPLEIYAPIWNSSCKSAGGGSQCSPFQGINVKGAHRSTVSIPKIECTLDSRVSAVFLFEFGFDQHDFSPKTNESSSSNATMQDSNELYYSVRHTTAEFILVAEGYWDSHKLGQLVMVAHCLASDASLVDSKILITLQIPMDRTIDHRYNVVGHVQSSREAEDPMYFASFSFVGDIDWSKRFAARHSIPSLRQLQFFYRYDDSIKAKIQPVCSLAAETYEVHKNARFPDGSQASDLEVGLGFAMPGQVKSSQEFFDLRNLAIDQEFRALRRFDAFEPTGHSPKYSPPLPREIPVSFRVRSYQQVFLEMEGFYDSTTGHLCLLGCRRKWEDVALPYENDETKELTSHCDMVFSIQYPPINPWLWHRYPFIKGTIRSLRDAGHPLYFEPVTIPTTESTRYRVHELWRFARRNAETVMRLASASLIVFFMGVQVHKSHDSNPRNLRFVSLVMLAVLASAHLFLLVLSFNSFWKGSPGVMRSVRWGAVSISDSFDPWEVIVRSIDVVVLLLELWLLDLVRRRRIWAQNSTSESGTLNSAPSKVSDGPVLLGCLPTYATMVAVVACAHWQEGAYQDFVQYRDTESLWAHVLADLQAFSGVVLDLFLLPQVMANVLWDTQKKVAPLDPLFYVGMTAVTSAAHVYDVARPFHFVPEWDYSNYHYANPGFGLFSTTWDIVIPCLSVFLAVVLHLQLRYGGRRVFPRRLRGLELQPSSGTEIPATVINFNKKMDKGCHVMISRE